MIVLIKPILMAFLSSSAVKELVIQLLEAYAESTDNTIDDKAVELIKKNLFPGGQMASTANRTKLKSNKTEKKGKFPKIAGLLSGTKAQCINRLEKLTSKSQVGYGTPEHTAACNKLSNHIKTAF